MAKVDDFILTTIFDFSGPNSLCLVVVKDYKDSKQILHDGTKMQNKKVKWLLFTKLQREYGSAREQANGDKEWYIKIL